MQKMITSDLDALLDVLPANIRQTLWQQEDVNSLLEVVMDLGRPTDARFPGREVILSPDEVTETDIDYVSSHVSAFGDDNRAGIERTLHRISAIRNRQGHIVGFTLRVGRAVYGTMRIIEDLVKSGKSILLLGRPGVGKTTMLREVARVLADDFKKRVIIVDTSNEIAGDGDIPHPAIGHARRMQVTTPTLQHAVMIEAVENHMPEVIVIDEIGTELEAKAARTIAERGVQLVGTAHGNTLENLIMNPTLSDLIGGIQTVTLGDEEAKRRGTQKSILERMAPPTFDIVVEIQSWERVAIHADVTQAVDSLLRGQLLTTEVRWLDESGEVRIEKEEPDRHSKEVSVAEDSWKSDKNRVYKMFLYGINRSKMLDVANDMQVKLDVAENLKHANILVTTKQYYRHKPRSVREAEAANLPVYVLKSNTPAQIRQLLNSLYPVRHETPVGRQESIQQALGEAEEAVNRVRDGQAEVELSPQSAYIRRLQHLIAEKYDLASRSLGKEPNRRVLIHR